MHTIRVDHGTEFINRKLQNWCHENGMTIEKTAPYSPSQNGVAERMNRTLVELARSMIVGAKLPEFLWEPAIDHATYLRNRAFTSSQERRMPYQGWFGSKPNVSHFHEFGASVWILLQGQSKAHKIQPKSQQREYVGYDENSKSVIYYNVPTRKILTSRNYIFLTVRHPEPIEEILIEDNGPPCKGECKAEAKNKGENMHGEPQRLQRLQEGEDKLPSRL